MNNEGKALVRRVLYQMNKPYEARKGQGITLAAPTNALQIGMSAAERVVSATKRSRRETDILVQKYVDDLPEEDKKGLLYAAALYGAIWCNVDNYRKRTRREKQRTIIGNSEPPIMPALPTPK